MSTGTSSDRQGDSGSADNGPVSRSEAFRFFGNSYIHQDQLSWSRIQSLLAIELATLAAAWATPKVAGVLVLLFGTMLVCLFSLLIVRDWELRDHFKKRLEQISCDELIDVRPQTQWLSGFKILLMGIIVVLAVNVGFVSILAFKLLSKKIDDTSTRQRD